MWRRYAKLVRNSDGVRKLFKRIHRGAVSGNLFVLADAVNNVFEQIEQAVRSDSGCGQSDASSLGLVDFGDDRRLFFCNSRGPGR